MPDPSIADLRQSYDKGSLSESDLASDPIELFRRWFADAKEAGEVEPNAMTLSTIDPDGKPAGRVVLLKDVDADGFSFYTNQQSRKSRDLETNPVAALTFWWAAVEQQVRVEGRVENVSDAEADAYFASRPRASQLGAWASPQSAPIADRAVLEERLALVTRNYEGADVPRPPHWGGYLVIPEAVEFWQGRPSRLHDRFRFERGADGWSAQRLAP